MRNSPYLDRPLRSEAQVHDLAHARYLRELERIRNAASTAPNTRPAKSLHSWRVQVTREGTYSECKWCLKRKPFAQPDNSPCVPSCSA